MQIMEVEISVHMGYLLIQNVMVLLSISYFPNLGYKFIFYYSMLFSRANYILQLSSTIVV